MAPVMIVQKKTDANVQAEREKLRKLKKISSMIMFTCIIFMLIIHSFGEKNIGKSYDAMRYTFYGGFTLSLWVFYISTTETITSTNKTFVKSLRDISTSLRNINIRSMSPRVYLAR